MSTRWRCAVCEAVNDGGDTCTACEPPSPRRSCNLHQPRRRPTPVPEGMAGPEERLGDQAATEIPVRELPRRRLELDRSNDGPYDVHDGNERTTHDHGFGSTAAACRRARDAARSRGDRNAPRQPAPRSADLRGLGPLWQLDIARETAGIGVVVIACRARAGGRPRPPRRDRRPLAWRGFLRRGRWPSWG
jgi:hypothetical protein